jgi:hypothetical protein
MDWLKKSFLLFLVTLLFISCVEKSPLPKLTTSSKIGIVDMEVVNFWNSGVSCWCTDSDELLVFAMLLIIIYAIHNSTQQDFETILSSGEYRELLEIVDKKFQILFPNYIPISNILEQDDIEFGIKLRIIDEKLYWKVVDKENRVIQPESLF